MCGEGIGKELDSALHRRKLDQVVKAYQAMEGFRGNGVVICEKRAETACLTVIHNLDTIPCAKGL